MGSPLAVFIIMRGADYKTVLPESNKIERIYNIFHPYDPVAYRLEPLFHENYRYIRPVKLFSYAEAVRHDYDNLSMECHKSFLKQKKKEDKAESKNNTVKMLIDYLRKIEQQNFF